MVQIRLRWQAADAQERGAREAVRLSAVSDAPPQLLTRNSLSNLGPGPHLQESEARGGDRSLDGGQGGRHPLEPIVATAALLP